MNSLTNKLKHFVLTGEFYFFIFFLLAILHIPIIAYEGDDVGIFDLLVVVYTLFFTLSYLLAPRKINLSQINFLPVLLFLVFITHSFISVITLHLTQAPNLFSLSILAKQIEYLAITGIAYGLIGKHKTLKIENYLYLLNFILFVFGVFTLFVFQENNRLGLPFKIGTSSNPAGFILTASLLILLDLFLRSQESNTSKKITFCVFFTLGYIALFATFSRTNNIIFLLLGAVVVIKRMGWHFLKYVCIFALIFTAVVLLLKLLDFPFYQSLPTTYILNPQMILTDSSFSQRISHVWMNGFDVWQNSPYTVLFGSGLGSVRLTDSLYANLLYTSGIFGLVLYLAVLVSLFVQYDFILKILITMVLINGFSTETTLLSYRTMQIFLIIVILSRQKSLQKQSKNNNFSNQ